MCAHGTPYSRVVDVQQPVQAHVDAQQDVDQVRVALLQPLVQAGQTGDQLGDVQQLLVLFQAVLVEHLARHRHAQQVHCEHSERGGRSVGVGVGAGARGVKRARMVLSTGATGFKPSKSTLSLSSTQPKCGGGRATSLKGSIKCHIIHLYHSLSPVKEGKERRQVPQR